FMMDAPSAGRLAFLLHIRPTAGQLVIALVVPCGAPARKRQGAHGSYRVTRRDRNAGRCAAQSDEQRSGRPAATGRRAARACHPCAVQKREREAGPTVPPPASYTANARHTAFSAECARRPRSTEPAAVVGGRGISSSVADRRPATGDRN